MRTIIVVSAATSIALFRGAAAFWRLECEGSTGLARLDPLMAHGAINDHVHTIKGGSAFTSVSTADDLLNSKCTSCGVTQDMSAYWTPAMYFMHDDGTVEVVPEKPPHKSYYLLYTGLTHDGRQQKVEAFPNGFQMVAGNNFNRNSTLPNPDPNPLGPWTDESQDQRAQRAIGFNCLHYAAGNDERTLSRHFLPDKTFLDANCKDGVRLELQFPSCWNGQLDGGPTHKSHVAYPDGVLTGNCPQGYDRRLISLFYETIVATDHFTGKSGNFVLANGDPTGFGYHGDFIAAWKDDTLPQAVQACDTQDSDGVMSKCKVFTMAQGSDSCKLQNPLPAAIAYEDVKGPMKGLVNGIQVYAGPEPAAKPAAPSNAGPSGGLQTSKAGAAQNDVPTAPLPSISAPLGYHSPKAIVDQVEPMAVKAASASTAAPSMQPAGPVFNMKDAAVNTPASPPVMTPATTAAPAPQSLPSNERILTTSYYTDAVGIHEVVVVLDEVYVQAPEVTVTVEARSNGSRKAKRQGHNAHVSRHAHYHHHKDT